MSRCNYSNETIDKHGNKTLSKNNSLKNGTFPTFPGDIGSNCTENMNCS